VNLLDVSQPTALGLMSFILIVATIIFHIVFYYILHLSKVGYKKLDYYWLGCSFLALTLALLSAHIDTIEAKIGNEKIVAATLFDRANNIYEDGQFNECGLINDFATSGRMDDLRKLTKLCAYLYNYEKELRTIDFQPVESDPLRRLEIFKDVLPPSKPLTTSVGAGVDRLISTREFRIETIKQLYNRQAIKINSSINEELSPALWVKSTAFFWKYVLGVAFALRIAKTVGEVQLEQGRSQRWSASPFRIILRPRKPTPEPPTRKLRRLRK
jgi:hypothetical protein